MLGQGITAERRRKNDLVKQKLLEERRSRHNDTPYWERYEGTGFAVPI